MAGGKANSSLLLLAIGLLCMTFTSDQSCGRLKVRFYDGKCGNNDVEEIIFNVVKEEFRKDKTVVAALLRLQFHDCFGCDASILLDGKNTEKMAAPNAGVRGYNLIDSCKEALEKRCPETVSCADIIAIATRVSVFLAGGKWYDVETGRRDGVVSNVTEAVADLPKPAVAVDAAIQQFAKRGFTAEEFVILMGGHTVGFIHCSFFQDRLYNFKNTGKPDPVMNQTTVLSLRKTCPRSKSNNIVAADQTPGSAMVVDNGFYKAIVAHKGLLQIDQDMADHPLTKRTVARLANSQDYFPSKFGPAMVKLGRVGVLTGKQGQIRKSCRAINHN